MLPSDREADDGRRTAGAYGQSLEGAEDCALVMVLEADAVVIDEDRETTLRAARTRRLSPREVHSMNLSALLKRFLQQDAANLR